MVHFLQAALGQTKFHKWMELCLLCQPVYISLSLAYPAPLALLLCLPLNTAWVLADSFKEKRRSKRQDTSPWGSKLSNTGSFYQGASHCSRGGGPLSNSSHSVCKRNAVLGRGGPRGDRDELCSCGGVGGKFSHRRRLKKEKDCGWDSGFQAERTACAEIAWCV